MVSWGKKTGSIATVLHVSFFPSLGEMNHNEFPFEMVRLQGTGILGFGFFSLMEKLLRFKSRTPPPPRCPRKTARQNIGPGRNDVTFGGQRRISGPISADLISYKIQKVVGGLLLGWFVLTKWRPNSVLLVFFWRAIFWTLYKLNHMTSWLKIMRESMGKSQAQRVVLR